MNNIKTPNRIIIVCLLILLSAAFVVTVIHADFNCGHCGKGITGQYYERDNEVYHPDCYEKNIAKRCKHCDKSIIGVYIELDGKVYHEDCYENNIALKCTVCGESISGQYQIDYWGNAIHSIHYNQLDRCEYCSRLICDNLTGGGATYPDNRHVCNECRKTAVYDPDLAYRLMEKTIDRLKSMGIEIKHKGIKLHLVGRNDLWKRTGSYRPDESGLAECQSSSIVGVFTVRKYNIYVLSGVPQVSLESILAHELMHVWLYSHGRDEVEPQLCEGSCQYAAFMHMSKSVDKYARYEIQSFIQDPDPLYGEGFRRVKKFIDDKGINYWLNHLKKNNDFPEGY